MCNHDILRSPWGQRLLQRTLGKPNPESIARSGADDAVRRVRTELRRAKRARSRKLYEFWAAVLAHVEGGGNDDFGVRFESEERRRSGDLSIPAGGDAPTKAERGGGPPLDRWPAADPHASIRRRSVLEIPASAEPEDSEKRAGPTPSA